MSKPTGLLQQMRQELLTGLRSYYFNIATNIYRWEGLPEEIPIRYPEKWLYENGMCTMLEIPGAGLAVLPVMTGSIQKNLYGEPAEWRAVAVGDMAGRVSSIKLNQDNSVLLRNDYDYRATKPYVDVLIKQLVNVEFTTRMNTNVQKNPMWFRTTDENCLQNKNTFLEFFEAEPVFFKDNIGMEFEFINSGIPFIGAELSDLYNVYHYRIMSYLGVDNPGVDKKERLVASESDSNNDALALMRDARLSMRELACEQMNDLFGINATVEYNGTLTDDTGDDNGYGEGDNNTGNEAGKRGDQTQ